MLRPATLIPPGVLVVAVSYGLARYTYGLFVPDIRRELGLSTEILGLIASGSYAGFLLAGALTAVLAARIGARLPVVMGALSAAAGMLLIAIAGGPWSLAAGVILAGTSPGFAYAPFSDVVVRLISEESRSRTYAVINAGTGFGVLFAGPVAVWAGSQWRSAWLVFATLAAFAALWNGRVLPSGPYKGSNVGSSLPPLTWRWLVGPKSVKLFSVSLVVGVASSVYWTFAVDLVVQGGGNLGSTGGGALFWTVVGAAGILGSAAGDAVSRLGLNTTLLWTVLSLAAATALLAMAPSYLPAALTSAVLFGAAFINLMGIIGLWSMSVFHDRPSAGFGAAFFLVSFGQFLGPSMFGLLAGFYDLAVAFWVAAAVTAAASLLRPRTDLSPVSPEDS